MSHTPTGLLDVPLLKQLAGDKIFAAGEAKFAEGRVWQLHAGPDRATGRVEGARSHRVKLWRARGEFQFACDCPASQEHVFCEHGVAIGLAWLATPGAGAPTDAAEPQNPHPGRSPDAARVRETLAGHLQTIARERLIRLVLEASDYDDILRRRLLLEAAGVARGSSSRPADRDANPPDFDAYRRLLREAIETADYVDYDAMPDYVHGVAEAVEPLDELLRVGRAAVVMELVELALVELDRASEMIDASDGSLNAVYDELQRYHLQACRAARLDPEKLAERLLHFELDGGLGVFNNAANTYADILGPAGLAAWRKLLIREWSNLPTLSPALPGSEVAPPAPIDHRRFQIQALMENLAVTEGDLETWTAVKQRDLSSAHDFLSLAEWHQNAGQTDEGISWAERGLKAFPDVLDSAGLRDFLAAAYQQTGQHDAAATLVWAQFARSPNLERYRLLEISAMRASDGWPVWRERALGLTRAHLENQKAVFSARGWSDAPDHSILVELLLADGADEEAWIEAQAGGCRAELWLQLAERRERTHPADSLGIYQARLGPTIAQGGPRAYREAIELLTKISTLLEDMGRAAEYDLFRAEVRATHRQKRNFVKLLDASGH